MPIRARLSGSLDEDDLAMLDEVLDRLGSVDAETRENDALQIIRLFQSGVTDPDELIQRVKGSL